MNVRGKALSPRQEEVMRMTAEGMTRREIASLLRLSPSMVNKHQSRVYSRLGLSTRNHTRSHPGWQQGEVMRIAREEESCLEELADAQ